MPRFYFHISPNHKVHWHFNRNPEIDEEIPLGATYGWCRVTEQLPSSDPDVDAEFAVEPIRPMTAEEEAELGSGDNLFRLPDRS